VKILILFKGSFVDSNVLEEFDDWMLQNAPNSGFFWNQQGSMELRIHQHRVCFTTSRMLESLRHANFARIYMVGFTMADVNDSEVPEIYGNHDVQLVFAPTNVVPEVLGDLILKEDR